MEKIPSEIYNILATATVKGDKIYLNCPQLERKLYEQVNTVLTRLGGKWQGGKTSAHVFSYYDPALMLGAVLDSGEMPPDNPTDFYPTPPRVVEFMLNELALGETMSLHDLGYDQPVRVLEPSAGSGALLQALVNWFEDETKYSEPNPVVIDAVEYLDINYHLLTRRFSEYLGAGKGKIKINLIHGDFLEFNPGYTYRAILMNPPFNTPGHSLAYIEHATRAFSLLERNARLVTVAPKGYTFNGTNAGKEFRRLVATRHCYNPELFLEGTFKESGTNVATYVITLENADQEWRRNEYNGHASWHCWAISLWEDNWYDNFTAKEQLFQRIKTGELGAVSYDAFGDLTNPKIAQAIDTFYREVEKFSWANGDVIDLEATDLYWLRERFMQEYKEYTAQAAA